MKLTLVIAFIGAQLNLMSQDKYAYVQFPEHADPGLIDVVKDDILVKILAERTTYLLFQADKAKVAELKKEYSLDIVFCELRMGNPCDLVDKVGNTSLTMVKYNSHITKFNVQDSPELFRMHDEHIKNIISAGNVVLEGVLDNDDGGFMLMIGNVEDQVLNLDPAVVNGIIEVEKYNAILDIEVNCN